jgi:hypothetical protein
VVWFEVLTGFAESGVEDVASQLVVDGETLRSRVNGRRMRVGRFEMPTLAQLRQRAHRVGGTDQSVRVREVVADAGALHTVAESAGAFFQVASQFNMLEMISPAVTPEDGVDGYEHDHTQGPACAVACGAGTIYRNYLVPVDDRIGQTADRQLNGLADLTVALGVDVEVRNGYALPTVAQLARVSEVLHDVDEPTRDGLMGHLRIGVQWDTEVTVGSAGHTVTQAYCAALPVAYGRHPTQQWESFARLILDAAYEATLAAATLNAEATGNRTAYLTLLGGGAFGNPTAWIVEAIARARRLFAHGDLDVAIVSYGRANPQLSELLEPSGSWADPLFAERPRQWGLRGDPYLWAELQERLRASPAPRTSGELELRIRRELQRLCGADIAAIDVFSVDVERYPAAGMSGGRVSPKAWQETLIPLLVSRFHPDGRHDTG